MRVYDTKLIVVSIFPLRIIDLLSIVNLKYIGVITYLVNYLKVAHAKIIRLMYVDMFISM